MPPRKLRTDERIAAAVADERERIRREVENLPVLYASHGPRFESVMAVRLDVLRAALDRVCLNGSAPAEPVRVTGTAGGEHGQGEDGDQLRDLLAEALEVLNLYRFRPSPEWERSAMEAVINKIETAQSPHPVGGGKLRGLLKSSLSREVGLIDDLRDEVAGMSQLRKLLEDCLATFEALSPVFGFVMPACVDGLRRALGKEERIATCPDGKPHEHSKRAGCERYCWRCGADMGKES